MAFVAIVVVLSLGALVAVPTERVAGLVADRISAATGRPVVMEGELRATLFPSLGVRVGDFSVGNPDWVEAGPLVTAERLDIGVAFFPLLRGEVQLDRAELTAPQITLVRAADGRTSWDFADAEPDPGAREPISQDDTEATDRASGANPLAIGADNATITNGQLRWIDETTGQDITVTDLNAALSLPGTVGRATANVSANIDGTAVEASLALDDLAAFLAGQVRALDLQLAWDGGDVAFTGRASTAPAVDGQLTIDATDFGPMLALAGAAMPDLPAGLGRDRIAARGQVTVTDELSLHLREGVLSLDDNELQVALDVVQGADRPSIRGTVSGGTFRLGSANGAQPLAGGDGSAPNASASGGWSTDPIDVSGLFSADAAISLRLAGVDTDAARLGAVEVNATLDQGRLVFEIGRIEAYEGRLAGQFVVNGRNGLSLGGDLILTEVQLLPLVTELAGYERLDGTGNASLQFLAVGNDMATLMSSLEGQGDFALGTGAILGLDLAGMIRNFDASFQGEGASTVYDSVTANFTIADGVLSNDDLFLDAPWGSVEGEGTVNIGSQSMAYRVIPGVMRNDDGQAGIAVPVLITGPWSNLSFRPDLEFLAEQEFLEQRDRLAAEAEAALAEEQERLEQTVRDRANELLGTQIEAGDGRDEIEDALTDRLSEETQGVLSRILGGRSDDE